jgi:amyloid beta precursor protein binding protein 1
MRNFAIPPLTRGTTVIESHSETAASLRIDKPFPALLEHAVSLDFAGMDPTDHGHIPYVVILVRAMQDWKNAVCTPSCPCL